jgi:hypothetical protein
MATREELERAGMALREAAARVIVIAVDGVEAHPTGEELEHAEAYAATAAMMRRRAAKFRARGDEDHAAYEIERADVFDARAAAKRAGRPMPRALRTPAESLARVDEFRRALAAVVNAFADLEADEWHAFGLALAQRDHAAPRTHAASYTSCLWSLEKALLALGVDAAQELSFRPFATPADPNAAPPV